METNKKTSVVTRVVNAPTEKAEAKKLQIVKSSQIEEAVIMPQSAPKPSLEETMRIINDLHTKTRQRNRLDVYTDLLKQFEIDQKAEDLSTNTNYYGCNLIIKDDKRRDFELRNPVIIKEVVDFLAKRFADKRAEIEAEIILP